jgi:hypothetical protein
MEIDWKRMAMPQPDGYDTLVTLRLAMTSTSLLRPRRYHRLPPDGAPTIFGGRVAVRNRPSGGLVGTRYVPASPTHPNLLLAETLVSAWPEVSFQFPKLIDTIQPWSDKTLTAEQWRVAPGSSSHSEEAEFGTIMVTVDSAIALAQAMVHEMAHHKLRALGISFLRARRLITNDPSELYISPIRKDRKRPMTAVLHAQYSFIHVTALDIAIYDSSSTTSEDRSLGVLLLERNVPKMEAGYAEIKRHARTDDSGAVFLDSFMSWSRAVLTRGREILHTHTRVRQGVRNILGGTNTCIAKR